MRYNVIHVNPQGKERIIRKNVSLREANEAFYGIDNTYIEEVKENEDLQKSEYGSGIQT